MVLKERYKISKKRFNELRKVEQRKSIYKMQNTDYTLDTFSSQK